MFSTAYESALVIAAHTLGISREWLYNIIALESAWNPSAYNPSGAIGLIQFMPCTLKEMNVLSSGVSSKIPFEACTSPPQARLSDEVKLEVKKEFLSKYPTVQSQLHGPVITYLAKHRPFPTEQSLYMAVLLPAFRHKPPETLLPAWVQAGNPGLDTVQSYVELVRRRARTQKTLEAGAAVLPVAAPLVGLLYFLFRKKKK